MEATKAVQLILRRCRLFNRLVLESAWNVAYSCLERIISPCLMMALFV